MPTRRSSLKNSKLGRAPWLLLTVAAREHPLVLLTGDDRDHPVASLPLGALQMRAHVIELAVIPARPVGLPQLKDRDPVLLGEPADLAAETITDRLKQRRRGDRLALSANDVLTAVDSASIGTNDLTQYTVAADRLAGELADLLDPSQRAVLRLIAITASSGAELGRSIGVCGAVVAERDPDVGQAGRCIDRLLTPRPTSTRRQAIRCSRSWSGTAPITYTYQWQRCTTTATTTCTAIAGATTSSYKLASADQGDRVGVAVKATNAGGSATAYSSEIGPVAASAPTRRP